MACPQGVAQERPVAQTLVHRSTQIAGDEHGWKVGAGSGGGRRHGPADTASASLIERGDVLDVDVMCADAVATASSPR
jgi:hypothetical protein